LFVATGCGGATTATVSGKVLYKGSVVPGGRITFKTDKDVRGQKEFQGMINGEGHYTITGLPIESKALIAVDTTSAKGSMADKMKTVMGADAASKMKEWQKKEQAELGGKLPRYREIPAKFANPSQSGVTVEIKQTNQETDIVLQ
jgi:hypothetical protein